MSDPTVQLHEPNRRLDAIDRKILMVLQEDASLSVAEIGDRVGLSSTPCWKRLQRLEAARATRLAVGCRDRRPRRAVLDAMLETHPEAGGRRRHPAPGRAGRPEQDRARYF